LRSIFGRFIVGSFYSLFSLYIVILTPWPPYTNGDGTEREVKGTIYPEVMFGIVSVASLYWFFTIRDARWSVLWFLGVKPEIREDDEFNNDYGYRKHVEMIHLTDPRKGEAEEQTGSGILMHDLNEDGTPAGPQAATDSSPSTKEQKKKDANKRIRRNFLYWALGGRDDRYWPSGPKFYVNRMTDRLLGRNRDSVEDGSTDQTPLTEEVNAVAHSARLA
jgi:hypothetical protein